MQGYSKANRLWVTVQRKSGLKSLNEDYEIETHVVTLYGGAGVLELGLNDQFPSRNPAGQSLEDWGKAIPSRPTNCRGIQYMRVAAKRIGQQSEVGVDADA